MTPQVALDSLPRLREAFTYLSVLPPSSATDLLDAVLVCISLSLSLFPNLTPLLFSFFSLSFHTASGPVQLVCEGLSAAGAKKISILQVSTLHIIPFSTHARPNVCLTLRQVDVRKIAVGGYLLLLKKFTVGLTQ